MSKELSTPQRDEALAKIEKALKHVFDICQGKEKWTMRVPARPDMDSDLIICDALEAARTALGPITQAAGESAGSAVTDSGMESSRAGERPADTPSERKPISEARIKELVRNAVYGGMNCEDVSRSECIEFAVRTAIEESTNG